MIRITTATPSFTSQLAQATTDLKARLDTTSQEAVTGKRTDQTAYLDGRIGTAMLAQKAVDDISQERSILALRSARLEISDLSLLNLQNSAGTIAESLASAFGRGDPEALELARGEAEVALEQAMSVLNTRHGERYLFAGDATATPPFGSSEDVLAELKAMGDAAPDAATFAAQVTDYFTPPSGGWFTTGYAGTQTASDPDAVLGSDPAITTLLSGLAMAALSSTDGSRSAVFGDAALIDKAVSAVRSGQTAVIKLRSSVGVIQAGIERREEMLNTEETVLTGTLNALTARDQYDAASELKELETTLEASYLLTARLNSLNLLNYLR